MQNTQERPGWSARRALALISASALAVLAVPTAAHADTVTNTVTAGGSPTIVAGASTTIGFTITNQNNNGGDPQNSCNPADGSPATLTVVKPAAVTVTPASRLYNGCATQSFEFSSATPGTYAISVGISDSGPGTYVTGGASFTLTVTRPVVVNTAPSVAITGVTNGASYEFGAVPAAACAVTDKEDGNSTSAASLSAVTGTRAADGLGSQTASCDYTDAGGLNAKASASYSIVDTTKPLVTATAPAATEATARTTPVLFAVTANDAVDGSRPVTCATAGGTAYASGDGFPVGTTRLTCSATDNAGNTGTADPIDVVVKDTTAPVVTTPANIVVGNDAAKVTYDAATATDAVDGSMSAVCAPASGTTFPLGTTEVTCSATDTAGNKGSKTFTVEVQDVTKPIVTVPSDITREATGSDGATVTWDAATAEDDVDGSRAVTCNRTTGTVFPIGTTTVTCSASDRAGNTGDNSFDVTVEDTTAPVVTVPAAITREATSAEGAAASWTATAHDTVAGDVATTCTPASGATFPLGTATVICQATDGHGNTDSASFTVKVVDTTAPKLTVPAALTAEATGPGGAEVAYGAVSAVDIVDGSVVASCSLVSGSTFGLGAHEVTCTASDAAGNTSSKSFTVEVVDTTAPDVTAPANLVVGNQTAAGATVPYTGESATDVVDGDVDVTCDPASGSFFPMGVTTVTCTATDAAHNTGKATFTVEVQDQTKPVVTVPADIVREATGPSGATVTWIGVTASDDVSGSLSATCDKASGSLFPIGTTTVTCSAKDAAGNTGDNHFSVTVEDTTAPTLTVSAARTAVASTANGAPVTFTAPSATDLVDGSVTPTCDRASGSVFALGSTTVTCTATDRAGNSASKSFTVTVTAAWSGLLQPVNADGSSVFKLGSTVPVKFQLTGASAGITNLQARLYLQRVGSTPTGSSIEAISTSSATTGNLFRYDTTSGQYVFNLSTKTLTAGTYQLRTDLGDGVLRTLNISLK